MWFFWEGGEGGCLWKGFFLSLELRNYKEFTAKLSELTDVEAEQDENIAHVSKIGGRC